MKSNLKFLVLTIIIITCIPFISKAQLVYIPDPALRTRLIQIAPSCISGDSIDPNCPGVLNIFTLYLQNCNISNLSGIAVFINATKLICYGNQITSIPTLPPSLLQLDCSSNPITSYAALPASLIEIDYSGTLAHPIWPGGLETIKCNYISQLPPAPLPALPPSLTHLECNISQVTSLPALPPTLTYLNCSNNPLNSLPSLPISLNNLYCENDQLTTLPPLPNSLEFLWCRNNQLSNLPTLPANLKEIDFSQNPITTTPILPSSLTYLVFNNTPLNPFPALPPGLEGLEIAGNNLTSIPPLPPNLTGLNCDNNQLTTLPFLPPSISYLSCSHNLLSSLPELRDTMDFLDCSSNPLTCFPKMKYTTFLFFDSTLINCVPNYCEVTVSDLILESYPLCDVFNSNGCDIFWNIDGTVFFDKDSNCVLNAIDETLTNRKVNLYQNGTLIQQTYSGITGNFDFDTYTTGTYTTALDTTGILLGFQCPLSGNYIDTISAIDSMKYDRDFALKCIGPDLSVSSIFMLPAPRPGHLQKIMIQAGDLFNFKGTNCANGVNGTVTFTISGPAHFYSPDTTALTPTQILGNVITYNVPDFGTIDFNNSFNFILFTDTIAASGDQICIQGSISPSSPDLNYNNNVNSFCATVITSYDPNDKSVYPSSTLDISGDRWLTYTIRFQNTGTAPAEHIYITDTLSAALDWSTFSLLSYSHQPLTQVYNDGLVKFSFPHINLPDSNSNEPASHGYVQFKIRVNSGLPVGSTIENTANIFFDFNTPVITNTTGNTVINCSIPPTIINASICGGDNYLLNNVQYYNSGVYTQRITTSVGCDSLIELHLSATTFNNSISVNSGTLQTSQTGTGYQWINCSTNTAISGATGQTYTPTQSGNYAVVVTDGICSDTSNCLFFSGTGIGELNAGVTLLSSINEETNSIRVSINGLSTGGNLSITDVRGKIIFSEIIPADGNKNRQIFFSAATLARGMYMIHLTGENVRMTTKVVR